MERDVLGLASSLGFIDEMYDLYRSDAGAVDPSWAELLDGHDGHGRPGNGRSPVSAASKAVTAAPAGANGAAGAASVDGAPWSPVPARGNGQPARVRPGAVTLAPLTAAPSVWPLVNAYRSRGHMAA